MQEKDLIKQEPLTTAAHPTPYTMSTGQGRGPLQGQAGEVPLQSVVLWFH